MITLEVNGKKVTGKKGNTILKVLHDNKIHVPSLCYMDRLSPTGACRLCVVEVEGQRALVPSCSFPIAQGMRVKTHSPRVLRARKTLIELLLSNHPDDCLYCERNNNCELQSLACELGVVERRFMGEKNRFAMDVSSPSIIRDPSKCILCGRCVRVCEEIQAVSAIDFIGRGCSTRVGTAYEQGLNVSACVNCGQCVMVCPTGALAEKSSIDEVEHALSDPDTFVVAQHAPSISVTLGEEFDIDPGTDVCGIMTAALRELGFDRVFDTALSADLTIMEEASELAERIRTGGVLPMMTSCSPAWIKFVEQFYPEFIENLSTCKSPQQMMGAIIKSWYAQKIGIDPKRIFSVSIMPCTAKKFEAGRSEMIQNGIPDIDAVLTTRELAGLIKKHGIHMTSLQPQAGDSPLQERTSAGKLFGATGGVMEAALRTAYCLLSGKDLEDLVVRPLRDLQGIKQAEVVVNGTELRVAVANGLTNARKLLEEMKAGRIVLHFLEVMSCPDGCIGGGGQPIGVSRENIRARMKALYSIDEREPTRTSHENREVAQLYEQFLGKPLGKRSHELLHTAYTKRTEVF